MVNSIQDLRKYKEMAKNKNDFVFQVAIRDTDILGLTESLADLSIGETKKISCGASAEALAGIALDNTFGSHFTVLQDIVESSGGIFLFKKNENINTVDIVVRFDN